MVFLCYNVKKKKKKKKIKGGDQLMATASTVKAKDQLKVAKRCQKTVDERSLMCVRLFPDGSPYHAWTP